MSNITQNREHENNKKGSFASQVVFAIIALLVLAVAFLVFTRGPGPEDMRLVQRVHVYADGSQWIQPLENAHVVHKDDIDRVLKTWNEGGEVPVVLRVCELWPDSLGPSNAYQLKPPAVLRAPWGERGVRTYGPIRGWELCEIVR